jgi:hypothetical protein
MDIFQENQQVSSIGTLYHACAQICERIMDVVMGKKRTIYPFKYHDSSKIETSINSKIIIIIMK